MSSYQIFEVVMFFVFESTIVSLVYIGMYKYMSDWTIKKYGHKTILGMKYVWLAWYRGLYNFITHNSNYITEITHKIAVVGAIFCSILCTFAFFPIIPIHFMVLMGQWIVYKIKSKSKKERVKC